MYRAVQEALTNCVRHAQARSINVSITNHRDHLSVSVTDDGIDFDPARRGNGLGLRGIEERVKERHDAVMMGNADGGGTSWRSFCRCQHARQRYRLRVLLADDHSIVRRGLRSLLEAPG